MKFLYEYRTQDNVRRSGVVDAVDRDGAYAALKAQGIRPSAVREAPGLLNKLFGKGKRWMAIGMLAVLAIVAIAVVSAQRRSIRGIEQSETGAQPRHQIYGDPALMSALRAEGYASVFEHPGERVLALFAQPGECFAAQAPNRIGDPAVLKDCLAHAYEIALTDPREKRELKQIVLWMKGELRNYLSNGKGTPQTYLRRLMERQLQESDVRKRIERELEGTKERARWENRNDYLRGIGIATLQIPEDAH